MTKRFVWVACIVLALAAVAVAQPPGHSKAFGETLGHWMVGWFHHEWLGDTSVNASKKVVYLEPPTEFEVDWDTYTVYGTGEATLKTGKAFAYGVFFAWGEVYEDGTEDDPDDPNWADSVFQDCDVLVEVDGKTVLDTEDGDSCFFETEEFDETFWYGATPPQGAVGEGAIWLKGLGIVHTPLSKGEHTLRIKLYITAWGVTYDDTWTLTVEKK